MATRTLTYNQINEASPLLNLDPDAYPDEILSKVLFNKKQLEPHINDYNTKLNSLIQEYSDGPIEALNQEESEENSDDESKNNKDIEEIDAHPLEIQLGVYLTDVKKFDNEVADFAREEVEVDLATASLELLREVDTSEIDDPEEEGGEGDEDDRDQVIQDLSEMDELARWHFMMEV